jgi:hypothetical protein
MKKYKLIIISAVVLYHGVLAAGEITLGSSKQAYPLTQSAEFMEETVPVTIGIVTSEAFSKRFASPPPDAKQFLKGPRPYWARFRIHKASAAAQDYIIETRDWSTSTRLFVPVPGGGYQEFSADCMDSYNSRKIPDRGIVFRLPERFDESRYFFLRTEPSPYPALILEFSVWAGDEYARWVNDFDFVQAIYIGFILVMAVYNFFLYLSIREKRYLLYVLYIISLGMWQFTFHNYGLKYLWPDSPRWNYYSPSFFLALFSFFLVLFTQAFLDLHKFMPRISRVLILLSALFLISGIIAVFDIGFAMKYFYALALTTSVIAIFLLAISLKVNRRAALYYIGAFMGFIIGSVIKLISDYGLLPINFITQTGVQLGSSFEIIMLSIALADRINIMNRQLKEQAGEIEESHRNIEYQLENFLKVLASAIESKDKYTGGHVERVGGYAREIAKRLNFNESEIRDIFLGAIVHDLGKIGVRDSVLNKPDRLDPEEMKHMQDHTLMGKRLLDRIKNIQIASDIAYCHQEKWDGSGYPQGLAGENIPLVARIVTIADYWDAIVTDRPYRKAMNAALALKIMHEERGKAFDPVIFDIFMNDTDRIYLKYLSEEKLKELGM